uniref:Uncharacterized protein n=1 Tax=Arundo donax TaxID=35708 RepID=A0A0A9FD93_ARUDO
MINYTSFSLTKGILFLKEVLLSFIYHFRIWVVKLPYS